MPPLSNANECVPPAAILKASPHVLAAAAPGSTKGVWHSLVNNEPPINQIAAGIAGEYRVVHGRRAGIVHPAAGVTGQRAFGQRERPDIAKRAAGIAGESADDNCQIVAAVIIYGAGVAAEEAAGDDHGAV